MGAGVGEGGLRKRGRERVKKERRRGRGEGKREGERGRKGDMEGGKLQGRYPGEDTGQYPYY